MRRIFLLTALVVALTFAQSNSAEAYNYDCGIYPESGLRGYLMTESISRYTGGFRCTVVCYPSGRPYYIDYNFWLSNGSFYFQNSDGYTERVSYNTPVESNVCGYVY